MNALQTLISETAKSRNLSRTDIVRLMGYKNTTKGLRKLDHFLATLEGHSIFTERLPDILGIRIDAYDRAIKEVWEEQETKKAAAFRPYIWIFLNPLPSPLFVLSFMIERVRLDVPAGITEHSFDEEMAIVTGLYKSHCQKYDGHLQPDYCAFNGFTYNRRYGEAFVFDSECRLKSVTQDTDCPFRYGFG